MHIISTREFRAHQGKYLDLAAQGQEVVLRSPKRGDFKLTPLPDDAPTESREAFFARLEEARAAIERGEGTRVNNLKELHDFLEAL